MVVVGVGVGMQVSAVGAALGVERGAYRGDRCAEAGEHVLDDVVATDEQAVAPDIGRQMAVANMPGKAEKVGGVAAADLGERFRRCLHRDDAAVVEDEAVAVAQRRRLGQVEEEGEAVAAGHHHPPAVTMVVVEHHGVGGDMGPFAGAEDSRSTDHVAVSASQKLAPQGAPDRTFVLVSFMAANLEQDGPLGYGMGRPQSGVPRNLRAILFDKDGTLLDFEATWTPLFRQLALDFAGGDPAEAEAMLVAGGYDPAAERMRSGSVLGAGTTEQIVKTWFPDLAGPGFAAMVEQIDAAFHAHGGTHSVPLPGAGETLDRLAADGYVMGIATNDATVAARAALAGLGLDRYVPHIFGYDSVRHPKPAPDIVLAFAEAAGVVPGEVVVVGDNRYDMEMARAAGAGLAVGVLTGNSDRAELGPYADAILPSIRDLPGWLSRSARQGR